MCALLVSGRVVSMRTSMDASSKQALVQHRVVFELVARYIFGGNQTGEIAMTAPVRTGRKWVWDDNDKKEMGDASGVHDAFRECRSPV